MIDKKDIKVGLRFVLPVDGIERYSDGIRYLVEDMHYSHLSLKKPGEVFRVTSVEGGYVHCDVAGLKDILVNIEILMKTGFFYDEISVEDLMWDWKEEISKWYPDEKKSGPDACDSLKRLLEGLKEVVFYLLDEIKMLEK